MTADDSAPSMKRKRIPSEKDDSGRVRKSPKGNRKDKHSAKKNYSKSEDGKAVKTTKPFKQKIVKGTTKPAHAKATKGRDGRATISGDAKANKLDHRAWKEMTENRKRKRKPYYDLQKELVASWEKMRQRNIKNEERSRLISEIMKKMKGKIPDIAGSHVSSRVLQTCIKYCEPAEKDSVYEELRPHFLALACNTYAVHLMTKMLDHASKEQLQQMISSLHGHVAAFLRHPVGSAVVEHAFKLANGTQKQDLLSEIYSAEFRLFKGLIPKGKGRLVDLLSGELPSKRSAILEHMSSALQPILEKGIVDHSIVHRVLVEYMSMANKSSVTDVIQQLSGPLLVRMIHTRDGSKVGALCVIHGSAKERKKIVKGMKGHIVKIAHDEYGGVVLMCILSFVDDTNLVIKVIIHEFEKNLKELALDKCGRRPILHLLCPNAPRYFSADVLATLRASIASLSTSTGQPESVDDDPSERPKVSSEIDLSDHINDDNDQKDRMEGDPKESQELGIKSKKDSSLRRSELLVSSGFAQKLTEMCIQNVGELLRSQYGKDVIFEVASGGAEGIMWQAAADRVTSLHRAIADLGALPQLDDADGMQTEEHVFVQYHSSRTIRKLILESHVPDDVGAPSFAAILWDIALKGKCKMWAQGHSEKVVSAFLDCADVKAKTMAKTELQPLIDSGLLKMVNNKNV
eukprot:Gb_02879 [translate_table: standard]